MSGLPNPYNQQVTVDTTGPSPAILTQGAEVVIYGYGDGAWSGTLQISPDGEHWADTPGPDGDPVTLSSGGSNHIAAIGGQYYRLDVTAVADDLTIVARRS